MKIKTSELTGAALDWAVATCEGYKNLHKLPDRMPHEPSWAMIPPRAAYGPVELWELSYSNNWAQGGPIIEQEGIELLCNLTAGEAAHFIEGSHADWRAAKRPIGRNARSFGTTPLVAAMRCFVASKLGDEVDVPNDIYCQPTPNT